MQAVQSKMVLVVNVFEFSKKRIVCFVVVIFDLVHAVDIHGLWKLLTASGNLF